MPAMSKDDSSRRRKKVKQVRTVAENIDRLRSRVRKDLDSDDEKTKLTALAVALMDKTAERVGNEGSAKDGHFGVTGWRCKHLTVKVDKVYLEYVGKSGVEHEKEFTDGKLAGLLKECAKRCKKDNDPLLTTSDGYTVKADRVNDYLAEYDITAKDIRGFAANRFMEQALHKTKISGDEAERKKKFLEVLKDVAERVGHTPNMLRNTYLLPGVEDSYIKKGKVTDVRKASQRVVEASISEQVVLAAIAESVAREFIHREIVVGGSDRKTAAAKGRHGESLIVATPGLAELIATHDWYEVPLEERRARLAPLAAAYPEQAAEWFTDIQHRASASGPCHHLRLVCVCGGELTCRCREPKIPRLGRCHTCTGQEAQWQQEIRERVQGLGETLKTAGVKHLPRNAPNIWYENEAGEKWFPDLKNPLMPMAPDGFVYQHSRFPNVLTHRILRLVTQAEVDACSHPAEHLAKTYGWIDTTEGRRCQLCGGMQKKDKKDPWPADWDAPGSREFMTMDSSWSDDLVLALCNQHGFKLGDAIVACANACERCLNALAHECGLPWGYPEFGPEWQKCNTVCDYCRKDAHP